MIDPPLFAGMAPASCSETDALSAQQMWVPFAKADLKNISLPSSTAPDQGGTYD